MDYRKHFNLTNAFIATGAIDIALGTALAVSYFYVAPSERFMFAGFATLLYIVGIFSLYVCNWWKDPRTTSHQRRGHDYNSLPLAYRRAVDHAIEQCISTGKAVAFPIDGVADVYAYPRAEAVCWGVNGPPHGFNIARDIYLPDEERDFSAKPD